MGLYQKIRPLLFKLPPEFAHGLTLLALKTGVVRGKPYVDPVLENEIWGMRFENPLGIAAGFDKDGEVIAPTAAMGFGFSEIGTVTPLPQPGNTKPRIHRYAESEALINSMGFPSDGAASVEARLEKPNWPDNFRLGVNVGKNKNSDDAAKDYATGIRALAPYADFLVINISSPNTPGLRDLQNPEHLAPLLKAVLDARTEIGNKAPLLVRLAPDLDAGQRQQIASTVLESGVDGLVVSNTTLSRPGPFGDQKGGVSGKPLFPLALENVRDIYRLTGGRLPIIGVGGVASAVDAYAMIRAGASLVGVYTALVYQGPGLAGHVCKGLAALLHENGYSSVAEAVAADVEL